MTISDLEWDQTGLELPTGGKRWGNLSRGPTIAAVHKDNLGCFES